jgi:iron complex outermembrane recepter protein
MTRHGNFLAQPSLLLMGCAAIALLGTSAVQAQARTSTNTASNVEEIETIVVTGTPIGRKKVDAAYSVSTMSEEDLTRSAPFSISEMLKSIPGFSAETSGGQGSGSNLYVRGLPAGGWRYVQMQEDGLTLFSDPTDPYLTADSYDVVDAMTQRVEVVRGGTAPVFADNAPGGIVNMITRRGTETPEGAITVTGGNHDFIRVDGYSAGPLADKTTYAIGGFLRQDNGYREPGFTADRGGQIRGSLSFDLGNVKLDVDAKYLNDRTAFYTAIPLADPSDPTKSLSSVFSPYYGTTESKDLQHTTMKSFVGDKVTEQDADLADGIHTKVASFGAYLTWNIADDLILTNKVRFMNARVGYVGVFSGTSPQNADTYLKTDLAAAITGFGSSVASVKYVDATTGTDFYPSRSSAGLVMESGLYKVNSNLNSLVDDVQLTKEFKEGMFGGTLGQHTVSAGVYFNYFSYAADQFQNTVLVSVQNQPHLLDVVALDSSGDTVGYVTDHGFVRYGSGLYKGNAEGYYLAPYFWDTVKFGDFAVDVGMRYTYYHATGGTYESTRKNLGDATTLADDSVGGYTGVFDPRHDNRRGFTWSTGLQYKIIPQAEVFARYTSAVRLAGQMNVAFPMNTTSTTIPQAEGGLRVVFDNLSFSATTFWSKFKNLTISTSMVADDGTISLTNMVGDTQTIGEEIDFDWVVTDYFSLMGAATIQSPEMKSLSDVKTGVSYANMDGNQISRIPKQIYSVTPVFNTAVFGRPVELSATLYYMGKRYVDYNNATALPSYTTLDLSILGHLTDHLDLQANASNITNTKGLTEGNPRTDTLVGQETSTAIYARPIFGAIYKLSLSYRW